MVSIIFILLFTIHGIINIVGFARELGLMSIYSVRQRIGEAKVLLWLFVSLLFTLTMSTIIFQLNWWWIIAIPTIVLSQFFILKYWKDAKFGSIINLIIIIGIISSHGRWDFERKVHRDIASFLPQKVEQIPLATSDLLADLPLAVKRWMQFSNTIGKEMAKTVMIKQHGMMRVNPRSKWISLEAKQYFKTEEPGFIWVVDAGRGTLTNFQGRDDFTNGVGSTQIKLYSFIPVTKSTGRNIDQGSLMRFIAEMVWAPSVALRPYVKWEEISPYMSRAIINYLGIEAAGVFTFDDDGKIVNFKGYRHYELKNGPSLETWYVHIDTASYKSFDGINIPTRAIVTWELDDGDFTMFKLEVEEVIYNGRKKTTAGRNNKNILSHLVSWRY